MAGTERTTLRVERSLVQQVAERHGLNAASVSHVLRFALALAAGADDPVRVATRRAGRPYPPRQSGTIAA